MSSYVRSWFTFATGSAAQDPLAAEIPRLLGTRNGVKVFLAALLASLLRSQQASARARAGKWANKG